MMPGRNQTGPLGMGPMTGRRLGVCGGQPMPYSGYPGRGQGYGRGFGLGFRGGRQQFAGDWFQPRHAMPYDGFKCRVQDEKAYLQDEAKYLEDALANIKSRIQALEKDI